VSVTDPESADDCVEHPVPQEIPAGLEVIVPAAAEFFVTESVKPKVAATLRAWVIETVQVPVPEQAPLQPTKAEEPVGVAVRTTEVPWMNVAVQVPGQAMPPRSEVTVPVPVPATLTVSAYVAAVKVTETLRASVIETVQVDPGEVPAQNPPHVTDDPVAGVAVSTTDVPWSKVAEHVALHEMPDGAEVTVPVPVPSTVRSSAYDRIVNVAVTFCAWVIVTTQVPVPEHPAPDQPVKVESAAGVAVRVTSVPWSKSFAQVVEKSQVAEFDTGHETSTVPVPPRTLVRLTVSV
jgi:hypothetical protein